MTAAAAALSQQEEDNDDDRLIAYVTATLSLAPPVPRTFRLKAISTLDPFRLIVIQRNRQIARD